MAGDIDDIVYAAEDAIVSVSGENGAVGSIVGPVAPVLALRILVVLLVILRHEALGISPNGLHDAGPGIANTDVAGHVRARFYLVPFLIPNYRIDSQGGRTGAPGFHEIECRLGSAQEAAGFGLPPGVHDDRLALAHDLVVPLPDLRLNGFANGSHMLEAVVVNLGFVTAGFAKHADGRGGSVENVDVQAFGDAPGAAGVGELRDTLIEDAGGRQSHRAVDDIGMAGDPSDVGHAPVDIFGMNVLVVLGGAGDVGEIAPCSMLAALRLAGGTARVHEEERGFSVLRDRLDDVGAIVFQDFVDEEVASHDHGRLGYIFSRIALPDQDLFDFLAFLSGGVHGDIGAGFVIHPFPVAVVAVGIDEHAAAGIGGAEAAGFSAEPTKDDRVDNAEARARQHGDGQLGN